MNNLQMQRRQRRNSASAVVRLTAHERNSMDKILQFAADSYSQKRIRLQQPRVRAVEEAVDLAIAALKSLGEEGLSVSSSGSDNEDNILLDDHNANQLEGRQLLNNEIADSRFYKEQPSVSDA